MSRMLTNGWFVFVVAILVCSQHFASTSSISKRQVDGGDYSRSDLATAAAATEAEGTSASAGTRKQSISERAAKFPSVKKNLDGDQDSAAGEDSVASSAASAADEADPELAESSASASSSATDEPTNGQQSSKSKPSDESRGSLGVVKPPEAKSNETANEEDNQKEATGASDKEEEEEEAEPQTSNSTTTLAPALNPTSGSRASDMDLAENDGPGVESPTVVLTIRGQKKPTKGPKGASGESNKPTTLGPSLVMAANGTNYLSVNGTVAPASSKNASEVLTKAGMKKLSSAFSAGLKFSTHSENSFSSLQERLQATANAIKSKLTGSSSLQMSTGNINNKGKLTVKSNSTSSASASSTLTTTKKPAPTGTTTSSAPTTTTKPTTTTTKPTTTTTPNKTTTPKPNKTTTTTTRAPTSSTTTTAKSSGSTKTTEVPKTKITTSTTRKATTSSTTKPSTTKKSKKKKKKSKESQTRQQVAAATSLAKSHSASDNKTVTTTLPKPATTAANTTTTGAPTVAKNTSQTCGGKTRPDCQCDYKEMKDSDKLLAIVITNKGGFKGRRVNAAAMSKIMSGKLSKQQSTELNSKKSLLISPNNTYVFPAGHYYFPHPIRFAGFVSP